MVIYDYNLININFLKRSKTMDKAMELTIQKVERLHGTMESFTEVIQDNLNAKDNESAIHNINFFMQVFSALLYEVDEVENN